MPAHKVTIIANCILKALCFVCITLAAMYFNRAEVLFWYIVVLFIGLGSMTKINPKGKDETDGTTEDSTDSGM